MLISAKTRWWGILNENILSQQQVQFQPTTCRIKPANICESVLIQYTLAFIMLINMDSYKWTLSYGYRDYFMKACSDNYKKEKKPSFTPSLDFPKTLIVRDK